MSGKDTSAVLVIDGGGSPWDDLANEEREAVPSGQVSRLFGDDKYPPRETISLYSVRHGRFTPMEKHLASYSRHPHRTCGMMEFASLGDMYGAVGLQIFGSFLDGPGKVMGLAPYGRPTIPTSAFYDITPDGFVFRDTVREQFTHGDRWPLNSAEYKDLAASVQLALEEGVLYVAKRLRHRSTDNCLCYSGGVALNSVANERLMRESGFQTVFHYARC